MNGPASDSRRVLLVNADAPAARISQEIATATERGCHVIVVVTPSSRLPPVIEGIHAGVVIGAVARPLRHRDILPILQRTNPLDALDDILRILGPSAIPGATRGGPGIS